MDLTAGALPWLWALWSVWCAAPWRARRRGGAARRWPRRAAVLAGAVVLVVTAGPWGSVGVLALVATARAARRHQRGALARRAAAAAVPDVGELLRIAVAAGLTPVLALDQVARFAPGRGPGREAARVVLDATRRGQGLADALSGLVDVLGAGARPLVDALVATERYGVPLEPALERAVDELRRARRTEASAAARRLPVLLSFPLVGCVLPAFALLTLAPLVAGAFGALGTSVPTTSTTTGGPPHARTTAVPAPARSPRP